MLSRHCIGQLTLLSAIMAWQCIFVLAMIFLSVTVSDILLFPCTRKTILNFSFINMDLLCAGNPVSCVIINQMPADLGYNVLKRAIIFSKIYRIWYLVLCYINQSIKNYDAHLYNIEFNLQ